MKHYRIDYGGKKFKVYCDNQLLGTYKTSAGAEIRMFAEMRTDEKEKANAVPGNKNQMGENLKS